MKSWKADLNIPKKHDDDSCITPVVQSSMNLGGQRDTVHTCLITAQTVDRQTETIGGNEKYRTTEVSVKKITTYQEWNTTWHCASEAICFAFPHRQNELNTYYRTILQKFDTSRHV